MVEVLHEERFETLTLNSMNMLTVGLSRFPLNLSCSSYWPTSPTVRMSLKVFNSLVQTSEKVECDRDLKLDGNLSKVL